jgi:hypothetical protein
VRRIERERWSGRPRAVRGKTQDRGFRRRLTRRNRIAQGASPYEPIGLHTICKKTGEKQTVRAGKRSLVRSTAETPAVTEERSRDAGELRALGARSSVGVNQWLRPDAVLVSRLGAASEVFEEVVQLPPYPVPSHPDTDSRELLEGWVGLVFGRRRQEPVHEFSLTRRQRGHEFVHHGS